MRFRLFLPLAGVLLGALACLAGSGAGDFSEALDPDTQPVTVTTTVDQSSAVSARIGPEGGTLTASGADGSQFTLEIPADALLEEIEVTMIPIKSMEGLPLEGGLAAGVQLEPEGMTFYDFVTLTVEPAKDIPVDQQIPIGSSGVDGAVYIPLIDPESTTVRLRLLHFSSGGVAKGFLADLAPVRQRLGGSAEARLESLMNAEYARARQTQLLTSEDTLDMGLLESLMKQWKEQVLKPRQAAAGESCAAARLAIVTVNSYARFLQMLGLPDDSESLMADLVPIMSRVCLKEEYELCRDEHIVHRMLPMINGVVKLQSKWGLFTDEMDQILAEAEDLARKCLTFELEFESTARVESEGTYNESEMESKIEFSYDPGSVPDTFTGSSALVNQNYDVSDPTGGACTTTGNRGGGTFEVSNLRFKIAETDDKVGRVVDLWLIYAPGISTETITATCPGTGTLTTPPTSIWSNTYMGIHQSELGDKSEPGGSGGQDVGPGATYTTNGWEVEGGELFAEKEWDLALGSGAVSLTEKGSFKLYHRPQ
jgi:hypothetical protein